ncbi:MAG: hypothetical protein GY824_09910 [Delftia sp.]|jgi:hypothetical protein|uniref:hypothetical protein n=1 Tax=Rhodanobacter sp. FW021-MT20 TaxID=1162282 RepID=UPI0012FCDC01|nr:hypothetical protein [Rhodanobacter sp. 115]MCP4515528.1 hypothetical protein [Delftia sp.]
MSPFFALARTHFAPVSTGRASLFAGGTTASIIATIITTGTGTTGSGWVSVRD